MKKLKQIGLFIALIFIPFVGINAQALTEYQNWTSFPDSPTHLEVSWKTCNCLAIPGKDEIRLLIFNETSEARTADFTLTISDSGQTDVTHVISGLPMSNGQMEEAECGKIARPELTIPVPAGFNPSTLTITITYQS